MRSLCISVDRLAYPFAEHMRARQSLNTAICSLRNVQYALYGSHYHFSMRAAGLVNEAQRITDKIDDVNRYVAQSSNIYRALEQRLTKSAGSITGKRKPTANDIKHFSNMLGNGLQLSKDHFASLKDSQADSKLEYLDGYFDYTLQGFRNRSLKSILFDGIAYQAEGALHAVSATLLEHSGKNHSVSVTAGIGNGEASGHIKSVLFDDYDNFDPSFEAEGEVLVSAVQAKAFAVLKNDIIKSTFSAQVDVGVAEASGKAVINKDEFTLEGEVGTSAAKAKAEFTIDLWFCKITLSGAADVGVGVGAGYSQTSNSYEVSGRFSCILGLEAGLRIDW